MGMSHDPRSVGDVRLNLKTAAETSTRKLTKEEEPTDAAKVSRKI